MSKPDYIYKSKIQAPGQLYLPKAFREMLNYSVGQAVKVELDKEHKSVIIKPISS